jgi:uncharacterized protein (TIGR00645 family)
MNSIERILERGIFASRWLLAPFYVGLIACIFFLLFHFAVELVHFIPRLPSAIESDVILSVLGLIDLTFTANLVLIVIFSGYENFVSRIEAEDHDRPDWMTKVDFSGLKQKLMTSIVAISAIQVLKAFMNVERFEDQSKLAWLVGIHLVFVMTMLLLAIGDRLGNAASRSREHLDGKSPQGAEREKKEP